MKRIGRRCNVFFFCLQRKIYFLLNSLNISFLSFLIFYSCIKFFFNYRETYKSVIITGENLFFYFQNIEKLKKYLTFIKKYSINIKNKLKRGEREWVI